MGYGVGLVMVAGGLQIGGQTADKLGPRIRSLTHTGEAF